ncbi:hypothetical protein BN128_219 [Cronobacter sakazakii 696]|nr:hypothetical protein BN128_219 [Cronobacter sakazakii 696]
MRQAFTGVWQVGLSQNFEAVNAIFINVTELANTSDSWLLAEH